MKDGFVFADLAPPLAYPADFNPAWRNRPICGVLACAVAAGVSFQASWDWHAAFGNRDGGAHRSSWRGATYRWRYPHMLKQHGKWLVRADPYKPIVPGSFDAKSGRLYLVRSSGHAFILKDGWLLDQTGCAPIYSHRCRKRRIHWALEVL